MRRMYDTVCRDFNASAMALKQCIDSRLLYSRHAWLTSTSEFDVFRKSSRVREHANLCFA